MVEIDGGRGEGGGQLLRSALSLSVWLGQPFRIRRIRAGRREPGLKAQHLAAVRAAAAVCGAEVEGATPGSAEIVFHPGRTAAGDYRHAVGTAGAATLVAQAVLPPLWSVPGSSRLCIEGGTHVAWSPPVDYLREIFAPAVRRLGLGLDVRLVRHGFYPRGGGALEIGVGRPAGIPGPGCIQRWRRPPREALGVEMTAVVCSLPRSIAERMLARARAMLAAGGWTASERLVESRDSSKGTYLFIAVGRRAAAEPEASARETETVAGGFTGLGAPGKRAEQVAEETAGEALAFLESQACVDHRLADQLLLPALVAGIRLDLLTDRVSRHLRTNAETVAQFLGPCIELGEQGEVDIHPPALRRRASAP